MKDALLLTDSQCSVLQELSGRLSQLRTGTFEDKLPQVDSEAYAVDPTVTLLDSAHSHPSATSHLPHRTRGESHSAEDVI